MNPARRLGALLALALAASAQAQAPRLLRLQGRLEEPPGTPVSGAQDLTIRLFDAESGGTEVATETDSVVFASDGTFQTTLGDSATLDPADFGQQLWAEFELVGGSGPTSPRLPLRAAPYALRAGQSEGLIHLFRTASDLSYNDADSETTKVFGFSGTVPMDGTYLCTLNFLADRDLGANTEYTVSLTRNASPVGGTARLLQMGTGQQSLQTLVYRTSFSAGDAVDAQVEIGTTVDTDLSFLRSPTLTLIRAQ